MNNNSVSVIYEQMVLGKDFKVYGTEENPLFLAKDVAEWIDYAFKDKTKGTRNVNMMLQTVDEEEKLVARLFTSGQNREMWFLTEDGIYEVLMQSRKPIAKAFKKEVKVILKQIRKTGGVVVENREAEFIEKYFPSFSEDIKKGMVLDLQKQNLEYKQQLEMQKPKVEYYDEVLDDQHLLTPTAIAKDLGVSAHLLNNFLNEKRIIFKQGGVWMPYAEYSWLITEGYADYKISNYGQQLRWTEKGRKFIIDLMKKDDLIAQKDKKNIDLKLKVS